MESRKNKKGKGEGEGKGKGEGWVVICFITILEVLKFIGVLKVKEIKTNVERIKLLLN